MTTRRQQFLDSAQRLVAVMGDWVPPFTEHEKEHADRLAGGEVPTGERGQWAPADMDNLDWGGRRSSNPRTVYTTLMMFRLLHPLSSAFAATGDGRYAQAARRFIEAFGRAYPVADCWTPPRNDGETSYPHRIGSSIYGGWLGTLHAFLPSAAFDDEFFEKMVASVRTWVSYMASHVYPGRNIRILHGDVLLMTGLRLPFLPEAERWRSLGVRILNDAVTRQILPDGADMEGSQEYHCDVMRLLMSVQKLTRPYPELGLRVSTEKIAGMLDYALTATRPDGALTAMNDSSYHAAQGTFTNNAAIARDRFRRAEGLPDQTPPPCRHFADIGQVFLRDKWGPDATYITFDATTRRGWHWHPSRNAIQLFANRRALLVDPGYPFSNDKWPSYGHKTMHHNTLNIDGMDQSHVKSWARLRQAPGYDLVEGLYGGGYWPAADHRFGRGLFGEHHRSLLWIRGRCIVVLDHMWTMPEKETELAVESVWQLAEGDAQITGDGRGAVTKNPDSNLLMLFPLMPSGMSVDMHKGERSPMRGWVPGKPEAAYTPAPMVRLHIRRREMWKTHLATVLAPFTGTDAPAVRATASQPAVEFAERTAGRLDIEWPDGTSDRVVWSARLEDAIDDQHGLDTDASLVHMAFDRAGKLIQAAAVEGGYLLCPAAGSGDLIAKVQRL